MFPPRTDDGLGVGDGSSEATTACRPVGERVNANAEGDGDARELTEVLSDLIVAGLTDNGL